MEEKPEGPLFEVKIFYREPAYQLWSESGPRPLFVARYPRIEASDDEAAAHIAQGRFREVARSSLVRWQREVVGVRVRSLAS
jgi:hypothetical protein